jgi:putative membrane protein
MKIRTRFNESDMQRIKDAVRDAEDKISGEIVPVIVERSGRYLIANYKGGLFMAAFTFMAIVFLDRYLITEAVNTLFYDPAFIFFVVALGGAIGWIAPQFIEPLKRGLVHRAYLEQATTQKAETVFLEEEVFNTRHRTGIMIFISFFEHEVIVMADRGISKVVDQALWDAIVADIVREIRAGKVVEGLIGGIARCGEILLEKGFQKSDDDVNELRDDLRLEGDKE